VGVKRVLGARGGGEGDVEGGVGEVGRGSEGV